MSARVHTLALAALPDEPPTEFRLFERGTNRTTKGTFLFDDAAARSVMAAAQARSVDVMLDLEHLSLDPEARNFDPDARGWGKLALVNGELWLTQIKWTDDGARRLRSKTQRYPSPAFTADKDGRISRLVNVAITALPATHNAAALVAADARGTMDPKIIAEALDALEAGDSAKALEILKALIASAAGAESNEPPEAPEAMADDPMAPEKKDEEMQAMRAIALAARAVTGRTSAAEVTAALTGLKVARDSAGDVTELRARVLRGELKELVRENPRKIASPKLEALVMASESTAAARALLDALPEVVARTVEQPAPEQRSETIKLTDEDRAVAKLTGMDPAKVLEFKRKAAQV